MCKILFRFWVRVSTAFPGLKTGFSKMADLARLSMPCSSSTGVKISTGKYFPSSTGIFFGLL